MGFTDYLENALLNHTFRGVAYTSPTTLYLALYTASPSENGGGTEVSGNAYARQVVTFGAPGSPGTATAGQILNSNTVNYPAATPAGWGTVTAVGVFDSLTGENLLTYGALTAPKTVNAGDPASFAIGTILLTLD